ncbi:hypothetical protein [Arthrobacter monumenti]
MNTPSARIRKITAFSAGPIAVLLAGAMVWQGSQAAFTATTRNAGNAWSTGQVVLTDDDNGVAGFTVENMVPGDTGQRCLEVTSNSTVAGEVRAYVANLADSPQGLEDHIEFEVEIGEGGSFANCEGFVPEARPDAPGPLPLSTLAQVNNNYASGGAAWVTEGTPGESKTYRGTWTFDTTGMSQQQIDALQGARVSVDLVWELQVGDSTATP